MDQATREKYEREKKGHTEAFELVKPTPHWKAEIYATIPESEFDWVNEAVIYFTGSTLQVLSRTNDGQVRVYAAGYWLTIGS